jgi:hypothetical protein
MAKARLLPLLVAALLFGNAYALEASQVKRALDRGGNWLIEQFDLKEKVFGKGEQAKDLVTVAMCVKALCDNPRDYKETSGPFISEPVKYILSQIGDDGTLKGKHAKEVEAYARVLAALKSTQNESYDDIVMKCLKAGPVATGTDGDKAGIVRWQSALTRARTGLELGEKPSLEETKVVTPKEKAEARAAELLMNQQKNGSFTEDVKAHAACLIDLNRCYRAMK